MSAPRELRDRAAAEAWLCGGLCLMRMAVPEADEYVRIAPWLLGVLTESGAMPPAGVIADIGHLVGGDSLRTLYPLPALDPRLGDAIHAYEDHVLGRLEADPRLDAVNDAVARLPADKRDRAIVLFITQIWQRMGQSAAVSVSPGVVRRVIYLPMDDIGARGHAALTDAGTISDMLTQGYVALLSSARRMGTLISEADVFLMENLDALGELTQRIAIEQIIEVAAALSATLPRRIKPRARGERDRIPTPLSAEDNYPTGGFSSLSTSGSLENLVISELIYMEPDDTEPRDADDTLIDLFDLRYAENELLYYTRDDSVFVRGQRVITFVFMPDLEAVRFKDPTLPWQRLIMAIGIVTCAVRRLAEWLAGDGLHIRIVFASGVSEPLTAERGLCELALRELIAKDMVEVSRAPDVETVVKQSMDSARRAQTSLILISTARLAMEPVMGVLCGTICLGDAEPTLDWAHGGDTPEKGRDEDGDLWRAWTEMALELLHELL